MQRLIASAPAGLLALLLLGSATLEAAAQKPSSAPAPTPAGRWKFATPEMANRCTMSGEMQVWRVAPSASSQPAKFACRFTAFQTCKMGFVQKIETNQTCSVSNKDGKLYFAAKVEKFGEVKPVEILETVKTAYAPDNFLVALNAKGDQMDGMFISVSEAPVKFVRLEELVS